MLWQDIIRKLKDEGYIGADDDLYAVKTFARKFTLQDSDGNPVDPKAAWDEWRESIDDEVAELTGTNKAGARSKAVTTANKAWAAEIKVGRDRGADDPLLGYANAGEWLKEIAELGGDHNGPFSQPKPGTRLERVQKMVKAGEVKALSTYANENTGADGGFAVLPAMASTINARVRAEDSLLSMCDTMTVPGNSYVDVSDETTPWGSTGIQAAWEGEAGELTQTKPVLQTKTTQLRKVTAFVPVTNELLEDSASLEAHINSKAPAMIDFKIGEAIIRGTGAGMPTGILNSAALVTVSKESNQPADTIKATNIQKMLMRLYSAYLMDSVFLMHPDCTVQLHSLFVVAKTDAGTSLAAGGLVYNPTSQEGAPFGTIYGRPIYFTQHCETLGDAGDVILVSLREYRAIIKSSVRAEVSPHIFFDRDATAFRFVQRCDGALKLHSTISPRDGSNTQSSAVILQAR